MSKKIVKCKVCEENLTTRSKGKCFTHCGIRQLITECLVYSQQEEPKEEISDKERKETPISVNKQEEPILKMEEQKEEEFEEFEEVEESLKEINNDEEPEREIQVIKEDNEVLVKKEKKKKINWGDLAIGLGFGALVVTALINNKKIKSFFDNKTKPTLQELLRNISSKKEEMILGEL